VQIANVLDKLPKRLQGRAKRALHEIMYAETRAQAEQGIEAFVAEFSPKYEKAVDCLIKDREAMLAFFDCPAGTGSICGRATPLSRASRPCGYVSA
ncbi:MAG: transposase, partial [Gammaproteobacteria bacterium]